MGLADKQMERPGGERSQEKYSFEKLKQKNSYVDSLEHIIICMVEMGIPPLPHQISPCSVNPFCKYSLWFWYCNIKELRAQGEHPCSPFSQICVLPVRQLDAVEALPHFYVCNKTPRMGTTALHYMERVCNCQSLIADSFDSPVRFLVGKSSCKVWP